MSLQFGEIRVHLQGGNSYVCPEGNKTEIVNSLGASIERIEHWKPAKPVFVGAKAKPIVEAKPKQKRKSKKK